MKVKTLLASLFACAITLLAQATDTTFIYGTWKLQHYRIYTHGKGVDTTIYTTGHVQFKVNHTYETERLQMCFMEGNNYKCPPNTDGNWEFTSKDVIKVTYAERELICDGACPDIMSRHGVYVRTLNKDNLILRTEYYNGHRKHRLVIDAYLVRKIGE